VVGLPVGRRDATTRGIHRTVGTVVGGGLYLALAFVPLPIWALGLLLGALQFAIEMVVVRHYALALVFITPLVLLLIGARRQARPRRCRSLWNGSSTPWSGRRWGRPRRSRCGFAQGLTAGGRQPRPARADFPRMHILRNYILEGRGAQMSVRHNLLAILDQAPCYGYQLRAEFTRRTGASSLNVGQIYNTLERLERDGLVSKDDVDAQGHVYWRITDDGSAAVREWFDTPVERGAARDELAVKVALAATLPGVDVLYLVRAQRAASQGRLDELTARYAGVDVDDPASVVGAGAAVGVAVHRRVGGALARTRRRAAVQPVDRLACAGAFVRAAQAGTAGAERRRDSVRGAPRRDTCHVPLVTAPS
jgi:DNA-binding PadR family transcriptional regulator